MVLSENTGYIIDTQHYGIQGEQEMEELNIDGG